MKGKCRISKCGTKELIAKGMCYPHYNRARRIRKANCLDWTNMLASKRWLDVIAKKCNERQVKKGHYYLASPLCSLDGDPEPKKNIIKLATQAIALHIKLAKLLAAIKEASA